MAKISIVVPVYNEEQELGRCVDSVLTQSFADWEMLLIDDGSTDRSVQMCDDYADKDPRITVVHQANRGYSGARNTALELVKSDYFTFLDADDFLEPNGLAVLYRSMAENDVDFVISGKRIITYEDATHKKIVAETLAAPKEGDYFFETKDLEVAGKYMIDICGPLLYCLWGNLYRTDIVQKHGLRFDLNLYVQEDVNFSFSHLYYTERCVMIKTLVYNYCREYDKDDVGARPVINQHRGCQYSLISFLRMAYKFKFSTEFCTYMYGRLAWQYLQLSSKIYLKETGLTPEQKRYHVYAQADEFIFRFYCEQLRKEDSFWADLYQLRESDDLEGIYQRFSRKMEEEGFPWIGDKGVR